MNKAPVLIVGGGPVGMAVALDLAHRDVHCILVERNATTTSHPKMDITNGRSMELFRRVGLIEALRKVAVPEDHPFDVSWITSLAGYELHRFKYGSVIEQRATILELNDGTQSREPGMRVSQVEIEPVLKQAIDEHSKVDVRFGVEFRSMENEGDVVVATVHDHDQDRTYRIACSFLIGCDGGGSRVRECMGVTLSGESRIMPRFMTHFRSNERRLMQRWGIAWHYQSNLGTLIAQNDKDVWTLHSRFPLNQPPGTVDPSVLLTRFAGRSFDHQVLVANRWSPHLLIADEYVRGRVLLAGDAAHQYIPTGGYGMNTGIGDAFDLSWKIAAVVKGFGGPALVNSYGEERRPVGLRNRVASARHNAARLQIASFYEKAGEQWSDDAVRAEVTKSIRSIGNAENEARGIEFGYVYLGSSIVASELVSDAGDDSDDSFVSYQPTTMPGARLPSVFLSNGTALYDLLGAWFTLLVFGQADAAPFIEAARRIGVPLDVVHVSESRLGQIYGAKLILVRPDQHIAWRGNAAGETDAAAAVVRRSLGW